MSRFRRFELVERSPCYPFFEKSIFSGPRALMADPFFPRYPILEDEFDAALDLLSFPTQRSVLFEDFETVTDLIQIREIPFRQSAILGTRRQRLAPADLYLQTLSDRVSALELGFHRLVWPEEKKLPERKYTWTAEIKCPEKERKYKWAAEIKDGKKGQLEKTYKWKAELKGKSVERTYTVEVSDGYGGEKKKTEKVKEKSKKVGSAARVFEIEEAPNHGAAIVLRQAFSKTLEKKRGKRKELSLQDAAALIQKTFRAYLIQRSQALRALRELAIAKNKLKEIRASFNNFTYRRLLIRDAEERQRFSEKIIILLLTVDAIQGADLMVRAAKKSIVDELEAMLDVVDPQPAGKYLAARRRTFNMPDPTINKELAANVAQIVQLLDEEEGI